MKNRFVLFALLLTAALPAWAQLGYQAGGPAAPQPQEKNTENLPVSVKKSRTTEMSARPDWYAFFILWAKSHPDKVLQGFRDPQTFDNFTQLLACDWVRDYRQNDVAWPTRQTQIIQKFNERVANPQDRFTLLTRGVLGPYLPDQEQFVFRPLDGQAFDFQFPADKLFGIEDDCAQNRHTFPFIPWPNEFVLAFKNPSLITALPMSKSEAEFFVAALPKNDKGEYDRHVVLEISFDAVEFSAAPLKATSAQDIHTLPPVGILATAEGAVVYPNMQKSKELARYGVAVTPVAPLK